MKKKVVGLLIAVLLCLSSAISFADSTAAATKTSADFTDLKDLDAVTKAKFDAMIEAGVYDGIGEGKFGLTDEMTRAQFAKVAALIFGLKVDSSLQTSSFIDVKADAANGYALPYIEAVKAAGITDGYGNGIFDPSGEVTKEQLAAFLVRGLGWEKDVYGSAHVEGSVSDWAKGYVALALEKKLLATGEDGTFDGKTNATRDLLVKSSYQTAVTAYDNRVQSGDKDQVEDESLSEYELMLQKIKEADKKIQEMQGTKEEAKEETTTAPYVPSDPPAPYVPPVQSTVATPAALPASGAVILGTQVTLSSATSSAAVYYTTDLSEPTTSSTRYTEPIFITNDTTIKAIAVKSGSRNSSVATFEYTLVLRIILPYSISPMAEGEAYSGSVAKLSGGTKDVTYAVTDGALPAGLTLDPNTGSITGTPSVSGAYSFAITATDSAAPQVTVTKLYTGEITPAIVIAPLDLINEAAESGEWDNVDALIFADAGVTGVTTSNVAAVIEALSSNEASPWTVTDIQAIVESVIADLAKQVALNSINEAAESGEWANVSETTFANAGVTGVTLSNIAIVIEALSSNDASPWTVTDIQAIVGSVIADLAKQAALYLINAASESGLWTGVDVTTFANAGVMGVTSVNLFSVQYYLDPTVTTDSPLPRTIVDIQAIVDKVIQDVAVDSILDYLNPMGFGSPRPTVEVFERAGITGVNASNIDAVITELEFAYQETRNDPFATPLSSKEQIQDLIDLYFPEIG
jgi:Putative Ig domain./S-layer homology domain.